MEITFNLPHLNQPGSSTAEKDKALGVLTDCIKRIRLDIPGGLKAKLRQHGSYFTFTLPHVFVAGANDVDNSIALNALLECLTRINQLYLQYHPGTPELYHSGVRYARTKLWESIPALYDRTYGDCKSLTAALVAQYRHEGRKSKPVFRFKPRSHGTDYHILVLSEKGWEDPSKVLGMGQDENVWFRRE